LNEQTLTIPFKHIRLIKTVKRDTDYIFKGGVGSLFLDCAGTAEPEIRMWSIENAAEVKAEIERRCRGVSR
ncbi:MAG: PH domain-containing protein, partial [Mariprofundaceae bacterium]|nr:PH domain-containing protein [Mariprofundaceae bacterium]